MAKSSKNKLLEQNATTTKLLIIIALMTVGLGYLWYMPLAPTSKSSKGHGSAGALLNSTDIQNGQFEMTRDDFSDMYFEVTFTNIDNGKVLVVLNGTKMITVSSAKYIDTMTKFVERDSSPFYHIFISYFLASQCFPVGEISFIRRSDGIWCNNEIYPDTPIFRRLCAFLPASVDSNPIIAK